MSNQPQSFIKKVGNYIFESILGKGSFAIVYLAKNELTQNYYAIKEISRDEMDPTKPDHAKLLEYLKSEVQIMKSLNHPNILNLVEFINSQKNYYLVLEYCSLGDLDKYIKKTTEKGRLLEKDATPIIVQLIDAMRALNKKNVVHRDLKLQNILISSDFRIKIADFGFAKFTESTAMLQSYCGTPLTMAPEILSKKQYTYNVDIWSLGIIIYQMIFGIAPFLPKVKGGVEVLLKQIETQQLTFPNNIPISDGLKVLLQQMIVVDPTKRLTFEQLLEQPWVKENQEKKNQDLDQSTQVLKMLHQSICLQKQTSEEIIKDFNFNELPDIEINKEATKIKQQLEIRLIPYLDLKRQVKLFMESNLIFQAILKQYLEDLKFFNVFQLDLVNDYTKHSVKCPDDEFKFVDFYVLTYNLCIDLIEVYLEKSINKNQNQVHPLKFIKEIWSQKVRLSNLVTIRCNEQNLENLGNDLKTIFEVEQFENKYLRFKPKTKEGGNEEQLEIQFQEKFQYQEEEISAIDDFLSYFDR